MSIFLRFLRWMSRFEAAMVEYQMQRLSYAFVDGLIDLDAYIVRKNDMAIRKLSANADVNRWDSALNAMEIQG